MQSNFIEYRDLIFVCSGVKYYLYKPGKKWYSQIVMNVWADRA